MHIVLWQNALCTFDSSFLRVFSNCGKLCCKSLSTASVATFCKNGRFSHQSKKLWVVQIAHLIIQKGR